MKRKLYKSEEAVSPVIAVILMVAITVVLAAVLYVWASSFIQTSKNTPTGALTAEKISEDTYNVQIIKLTPTVSVNSINFFLLDDEGKTKANGAVADIYGYFLGQGKGVVFADNDYNGKLSPGDLFTIHAGEKGDANLEGINNLNGYKFRLKFTPTGENVGQDVPLA